jgi:hypothetical protein
MPADPEDNNRGEQKKSERMTESSVELPVIPTDHKDKKEVEIGSDGKQEPEGHPFPVA